MVLVKSGLAPLLSLIGTIIVVAGIAAWPTCEGCGCGAFAAELQTRVARR